MHFTGMLFVCLLLNVHVCCLTVVLNKHVTIIKLDVILLEKSITHLGCLLLFDFTCLVLTSSILPIIRTVPSLEPAPRCNSCFASMGQFSISSQCGDMFLDCVKRSTQGKPSWTRGEHADHPSWWSNPATVLPSTVWSFWTWRKIPTLIWFVL